MNRGVSEAVSERLPLSFKETPDYAEVYDAKGELVALTTRPEFFEALATAALAAEPAEMVLVPREPTEIMIDNAEETMEARRNFGLRVYASDVWEAMLAAAPLQSGESGK